MGDAGYSLGMDDTDGGAIRLQLPSLFHRTAHAV